MGPGDKCIHRSIWGRIRPQPPEKGLIIRQLDKTLAIKFNLSCLFFRLFTQGRVSRSIRDKCCFIRRCRGQSPKDEPALTLKISGITEKSYPATKSTVPVTWKATYNNSNQRHIYSIIYSVFLRKVKTLEDSENCKS